MKSISKIFFVKAKFSDIEFLWYLRNHPDVYKYFKKGKLVSWKEHINWILPILLEISNKKLFVIQSSKKPVGQIRFDFRKSKEAKISISILKEFRGRGFAIKALNLAIKKVRQQKKMKFLVVEIHKKNLPSIKLFEKLGFKLKTKKGNWSKYILKL